MATKVVEDKRLNDLAKNLEAKAKVFDKLRCAMRIALPEGKNGINDNGDSTDMKSIEDDPFRTPFGTEYKERQVYGDHSQRMFEFGTTVFSN